MNQDNQSNSEQSQTADPGDIIRTKICLTNHYNRLLDKIVEKRYASRSEAVRASIQHHSQSLSENENTDIDSLQAEIKQLTKEIETLHEKIEKQNSSVVHVDEQSSGNLENSASETYSKTENKIIKQLTKSHPLSIDELVEKIGEDVVSVVPAIKSLQKGGIISPASENTDKYEIDI